MRATCRGANRAHPDRPAGRDDGRVGIRVALGVLAVVAVCLGGLLVRRELDERSRDRRVLVVGDSLASDALREIHDQMSFAGYEPRIVSYPGTDIGWAVDRIAAEPDYDVIVVASGANNALDGWTSLDEDQIDDAARLLDLRGCAVWILPANRRYVGDTSRADRGAQATVDGIIGRLAESDVHVANWPTFANLYDGWHADDGVHHTTAGRSAFATFMVRETREACLS